MSDLFILQTVWQENGALRFLVKTEGESWKLTAEAIHPGDLPIESALNYAEGFFGPESVCTLWKLGQIKAENAVTHIFCLDTETIEGFSSTTEIPNMTWVKEDEFYKLIPQDWLPIFEKIKQHGVSK